MILVFKIKNQKNSKRKRKKRKVQDLIKIGLETSEIQVQQLKKLSQNLQQKSNQAT